MANYKKIIIKTNSYTVTDMVSGSTPICDTKVLSGSSWSFTQSELPATVYYETNETPTTKRILIASDTDHITDSGSILQSKINRVFYKQACKEFSSNGGDITVANGMDGYVLSGKIEGQTVKRIQNKDCWYDATDSGFWAINYNKNSYDNSYYIYNNTDKPIKLYPTKWIDSSYVTPIKIQTQQMYKLDVHYIDQIRCLVSDGFLNTQEEKENLLKNIIICSSNKVTSYIPFGLSSTQALVYNNGLKYSF